MGPVKPMEMPGLEIFQSPRLEGPQAVPLLLPPSSPRVVANAGVEVGMTQVSASGVLPPSPRAGSNYHKVTTLYDFHGEGPGELSFVKGEQLTITVDPGDGWLMAVNNNGQQGLVPSNYVGPI